MNSIIDAWATLNHGGLLLSNAKLQEHFHESPPPLSSWDAMRLRRALTAFDGSRDALGPLLDCLLEDLSGLPADEWQKAQAVESRWAIRSFTGVQVKPRRLWLGPSGEVLPVFVPEDGASRQLAGRLGVGRSRQLLGRVLEWLRRQQQPLALVTNGRQWRLALAGRDYDAWCEWDIDLWFEEGQPGPQTDAWRGLLNRETLLAPEPAQAGQSRLLTAISESRKGQADLSSVLGERVREAVEELITASHPAIDQAQRQGAAVEYKALYVAGARIVMRCIITLFAEARGLLPVDNPVYQQGYSLEGLRQQLERRAGGRASERLIQGRSAWPRLLGLFSLIYHGSAHPKLAVPAYGGALFQAGDAEGEDPIARALALLESPANAISDAQVHSLLRLLTRTKMKIRQGRSARWVDAPVDFSALSSEYIGILYEGLLDYELKQAEADNPVIFLAVGKQPALTLAQLEAMDDKAIKQLFAALKKKDQADEGEAQDESETLDEAGDGAAADDAGDLQSFPMAAEPKPAPYASGAQPMEAHHARTQAWLQKAAQLAGLARKPKGSSPAAQQQWQASLEKAAEQLCARLVAPGQFYLVRWGGTRKGAGTFYTRPQLAGPTVRRTLQPLAYQALGKAVDERTGLEEVTEWAPKTPQQILALKVCDPSMGSGSFLASALRYLTDALVQSLYHHGLIEKGKDGGVPRLADGQLAELLSDEITKLNPAHEDFEERLRGQLKRHIVERCLYGVDLDPLAVELGRMALWVETMDRDLPFGFLDHKLKVGNALVGAWFDTCRHYPAMAWQREGGDKDYQKNRPANLVNHHWTDAKGKKRGDVFTQAIRERGKAVPKQLADMLGGQMELGQGQDAVDVHDELLEVFLQLHQMPVHEASERAALYQQQVLNNPHYHALKGRMDLWCALWFWPGGEIGLAPLPLDFARPTDKIMAVAAKVAQEQRFFHWELEYPDVFTVERQGFDAVVGNPPWDIQKPNSKEFFSNHDPLYRAYGKQEALAKQLAYFRQHGQLEHDWIAYTAGFKERSNWAKHAGHPFGDRVTTDVSGRKQHDLSLGGGRNSFERSALLHRKWQEQRSGDKGFADHAHPFLHQGSADLNTYKMFLEVSHNLLDGEGRLGMIAPSGIYTDNGTTALRTLFLERCDWQWLFGFENREGIFDIHRSFKFGPVIVRKGGETASLRAAFMHRNVDDWEDAENHVLAYPRAQVLDLSPRSKAILEVRSNQDLSVLQKIYSNGVLLGDQSEQGWRVKYATEFHMTNDSKLFLPRPDWESRGYLPDEYGHWLKGPWRPYNKACDVLERESGLVLSRDGKQSISAHTIQGVALPLYQGVMINCFDYNSSRHLSGAGNRAKWEQQPFTARYFQPQFLVGAQNCPNTGRAWGAKLLLRGISNPTNSRTMLSAFCPDFPSGNTCPVLHVGDGMVAAMNLGAVLNSFVLDYSLRVRFAPSGGAGAINPYILHDLATTTLARQDVLTGLASALMMPSTVFSEQWMALRERLGNRGWRSCWAVSSYERLRKKAMVDATVASLFCLDWEQFAYVLSDCDWPVGVTGRLDPKGFWRVDKDREPELRHTVLSLVAFHDLQEKGLDAFLAQNDGEGWMLPETLRLADYGLGHDDRAKQRQPVAKRLGPRFYDWQLNQDVERSWQECEAHAALIRQIRQEPETPESAGKVAEPPAPYGSNGQDKLF